MIKEFQGKYRFLSNFYPVWIYYEGINYRSTEHAYQAAKFNDESKKLRIAHVESPSTAKRLGRNKTGFRTDWDTVKLQVMYDICKLKFVQESFKTKLLETGNEELIEGNWWGDDFWGVCTDAGQNNLGKILMRIREELKKEEY